jgi:hypothetical protein
MSQKEKYHPREQGIKGQDLFGFCRFGGDKYVPDYFI